MPIRSVVEKITPEVAMKILEDSKDIKNRTVAEGHVEWLAAQMKAGKWTLNGEAIIIDDEGQLVDGQHRLWAVVNSGVTIDSMVTRGVERKGFATIDTGNARTLANVLGVVGEKYAAAIAAALSWIHRHELGKMFSSSKSAGFSHQVGLSLIRKHSEIRESAEEVHRMSAKSEILKGVPASTMIFLHYRFSTHSREKTTEFFETLGDLRFDAAGTPTRILRDQILRRKMEIRGGGGGSKTPPLEMMAFFIKAWTDFLSGRKPGRPYQWRRSGQYPEDFPKFPGEKESAGKALKIVRRRSKPGEEEGRKKASS
jgi:hypothetical protein